MSDVHTRNEAGPAIRRRWVPVFTAYLVLASLVWLEVFAIPAFWRPFGLGAGLAVLGTALFLVGLSQVLIALKCDAGGNRRLILPNGGFALAVPLPPLAHDTAAASSGGIIRETFFPLAAMLLSPAVIATSFLRSIRAFRNPSALRDQSRSRGGKAGVESGPRRISENGGADDAH